MQFGTCPTSSGQERRYFFINLFICIREPRVVTWSLLGRERTLGMRRQYAFGQKNHHHFAALILCYTCKLFMASLARSFVSAKRLFRDLKPQTFHKYLTIVCFKFISWMCSWLTLDMMLNEFGYEVRLKVCEESLGSDKTPRQPRTFHKDLTIVFFCISFCFSTTIPWSG